jgi:hypothetical protein
MCSSRRVLLTVILALASAGATQTAMAECKTLYYSVNDYGKEGPAKDAQNLLDKLIVKWTAEKGIKKYKVGKKDVQCELFLDVGVFDEYTCKASANVCW